MNNTLCFSPWNHIQINHLVPFLHYFFELPPLEAAARDSTPSSFTPLCPVVLHCLLLLSLLTLPPSLSNLLLPRLHLASSTPPPSALTLSSAPPPLPCHPRRLGCHLPDSGPPSAPAPPRAEGSSTPKPATLPYSEPAPSPQLARSL